MITLEELRPGDIIEFDDRIPPFPIPGHLFGMVERAQRFSFHAIHGEAIVLIPVGLSITADLRVPVEALERARKIPKTTALN